MNKFYITINNKDFYDGVDRDEAFDMFVHFVSKSGKPGNEVSGMNVFLFERHELICKHLWEKK